MYQEENLNTETFLRDSQKQFTPICLFIKSCLSYKKSRKAATTKNIYRKYIKIRILKFQEAHKRCQDSARSTRSPLEYTDLWLEQDQIVVAVFFHFLICHYAGFYEVVTSF